MKKILLEVLILVLTAIVSAIGFVALLLTQMIESHDFMVFIPALVISYIILYPVYKHWSDFFRKIIKP